MRKLIKRFGRRSGYISDLVHLAQYILTLSYRDSVGNDAASSSSVAITFDTFTILPTLDSPVTNARFKRAFFFEFTIPEDALPGSVTITFTPVGSGSASLGSG